MPQTIRRAVSTLRTEMFTTVERAKTNKAVVAYTGHTADPRIDAQFIDGSDCSKGYFGCSHHYIINTAGMIEVGRDPKTRSSRTRMRRMHHEAIFIGVVGGLATDTGYRITTVTPEQNEAVEWLLQELANTLGTSLEITDHIETWASSRSILKSSDAIKARNTEFLSILYAEMTDEEINASTDRVTA